MATTDDEPVNVTVVVPTALNTLVPNVSAAKGNTLHPQLVDIQTKLDTHSANVATLIANARAAGVKFKQE